MKNDMILVNVKALVDELNAAQMTLMADGNWMGERLARIFIKIVKAHAQAKPVDAEPVVRCKDCIHYREGEIIPGVKFCYRLKGKDGKTPVGYNFSPDDFCSRGEKKDGGA